MEHDVPRSRLRIGAVPAALLIVAAVAIGGYAFLSDGSSAPAGAGYRLARADRGDIVATVNATGTINPVTTVIVGSQLSGQVVEILADYNSQVKAGQVVARLNSDQIRARLDAARADLEQMRAQRLVQQGLIEKVRADGKRAEAALADMEAQVQRNEALFADAERIFRRQSDLRNRGFAAEATFETAKATRDAQEAALNSARAQVLSAKAQIQGLAADLQVAQANLKAVEAQIAQREAAVRQIEVDLANTEIRSPVSGVVVQRNVELGQTVAASLQAPTLFLIADDLHRMEIAANIDETDVGRVKAGQQVTFTVNAYPGREFEGAVKQVRLGAQNVQNVVIYTAIVTVENPRLELLPGMTANLRVETDRREDVLRIPNAALRWRPPATAELATPVAGERAPSPAGGRNGALADLAATLKSELKLTAAQGKEVDAAFADARKAFAALAEEEPATRRERARKIRQDLEARIALLLDAGQRSQFSGIVQRSATGRSAQTARVFVVGENGRPKGVTVRIGASDGAQTEALSGIAPDQELIVGGGPKVDATARFRRLGF
jgi:HlyD family secretion protein